MIVTTLPRGGGGDAKLGGSDDAITMTIALFWIYILAKCVKNDWTVWTVSIGCTNPCAMKCAMFLVAQS